MMSTREALEAALVLDPDDPSLHAAYADLLQEQGDPRGEYCRLALLAEDRNQSTEQLRAIEQAMFTLRQQHEQEWLGPLAPLLARPQSRSVAEPMEPNVSISWRRGWIDAIRIGQLNQDHITAIAECKLTRILGELTIEQNRPERTQNFAVATTRRGQEALDRMEEEFLEPLLDLTPLTESGRLKALRVFKLGSFADEILASGWELEEYLADAPLLEDVRICTDTTASAFLFGQPHPRLHTLHVTGNQYRVPFALLGYNDRIPNLQSLFIDSETFRPRLGEFASERQELGESDFLCLHRAGCLPALEEFTLRDSSVGDEGLRLILDAPFFSRLKHLDLSRCNITDEGAEWLARHPHTKNLTTLRLTDNLLSPIGMYALDELGFSIGPQAFTVKVASDDDDEFPEDIPPRRGPPA